MGSTERNGNGSRNGSGNGHGTVVWPAPLDDAPEHERGIELAQIWTILREGWRFITVIALAVIVLIMVVTLRARMEFTLRSSIYLGDLKSAGGMFEGLSAEFGGEKGDIGTEIEILRSRALMTDAVLTSGLNTRVTSGDWSPPRYWRWRLDSRDLRSLEGVWGELRAVSTRLTDSNSAERVVDIVFTTPSGYNVRSGENVLGTGTIGKPLILPGMELTLLAGTKRGPQAGSRYRLHVLSLDTVLEEVAKGFSARAPRASSLGSSQVNVVHLTLTTKAPFHGRMFLEQLMHRYLEQNLSWKTEEAGAAEKFLTKQLENIRDSVDKAGNDLAEFKKSSETIVLTEEAKSMIGQMGDLEQQRVAVRLQVTGLEQVKAALAKGNVSTEAYLLGEAQDTVLVAMSEMLVKAKQEHKRLGEQFTPDYPLVREAQASIDAQLAAIRSYVDNRLKRAKEQQAALDTAVDRYTEKLKKLPDAELKLATLTQKTEVYSKLYQFLLERQQQAALTKASTISKSRVLDPPIIPSREASPNLQTRGALAIFLGLFLGLAFVVARRQFATTFQSEQEVRSVLANASLFASIPRGARDKKADAGANPFEGFADLRSPFAEAFRLLRTNLYYSGSRDQDEVLLITSPGPGDGKTLTTLCLAAILTADGKRVLVIDGDMRKPSHHILLRQPQHVGLSGILTGATHWSKAVRTVHTPLGDISSITTGVAPPNPAELLSGPNLADFLAEAKAQYDFVLVDSPPFPLVSDALILSQSAVRGLSVIRVGNTRRRIAEEHVRRLSSAVRHHGIVINDVSSGQGYGYGYGYGESYGVTPTRRKRGLWRSKKDTSKPTHPS